MLHDTTTTLFQCRDVLAQIDALSGFRAHSLVCSLCPPAVFLWCFLCLFCLGSVIQNEFFLLFLQPNLTQVPSFGTVTQWLNISSSADCCFETLDLELIKLVFSLGESDCRHRHIGLYFSPLHLENSQQILSELLGHQHIEAGVHYRGGGCH